jgi:hypothetical protein
MTEQYFDRHENKWLDIPGPCYIVNLPICPYIPALRYHELIAHRNVDPHAPSTKAWTVTHRKTSFLLATGRTRTEAITHAQAALLAKGNEMFLKAVNYAEHWLKTNAPKAV